MNESNGQPKVRIDYTKAKKLDKISTKVEWKDGIILDVSFLPRPALQKFYEQAQMLKMDEVEKIRKQVHDNEKFADLFCQTVMNGWEGMTVKKLGDILPIDLSEYSDPQAPVQFSLSLVTAIFRDGFGLDTFIQPFVCELSNFRPHLEHEMGNSGSSPSGS